MQKVKESFKTQLNHYHQLIDADIAGYVKYLQQSSDKQFGETSTPVVKAFCDLLSNGGKRLRGALTIVGYEMSGGTNMAMIIQAARAMEMLHTALLILDDLQDRSTVRRGQPAAYVQLGQELGDKQLGEAMAINAALLGNYAAEMILANLDVESELRANVVSITNRTLLMTIHGQNADQLSALKPVVSSNQIALWKTAPYSVLNPLHVGMVLAGAGCEATDAITPYALELGQAFQIVNDINGVFGDDNGKDPLDDIREGKRTPLTEFALKNATDHDKKFLQATLGNPELTGSDFKHCQTILKRCGALEHARAQANMHAQQALDSLQDADQDWSKPGTNFLSGLAESLMLA